MTNRSENTAMAKDDAEQRKGSMWKALLIVLIALLLLIGSIVGVLMLSGGNDAATTKPTDVPSLGDPVAGKQVTMRPDINCVFCHSEDGSTMIGPSFKGLFGSTVKYDDGSTALIDESAVRYALKHPIDKIVDGFEPRMPELDSKLSETDKVNLIAYLRSIGKGK